MTVACVNAWGQTDTVRNDTVLFAVENSLLTEAVGILQSPTTVPDCVEGVDSLKNYFRHHPIKDGRGMGMIFKVHVAFIVDTNGEVTGHRIISSEKGLIGELSHKAVEVIKEAPLHWKPATDAEGNNVACWQVLSFTVVECSLAKCDYVH